MNERYMGNCLDCGKNRIKAIAILEMCKCDERKNGMTDAEIIKRLLVVFNTPREQLEAALRYSAKEGLFSEFLWKK